MNNRFTHRRLFASALTVSVLLLYFAQTAHAYDLHFDYTSFETGFQQAQFNVLNYPSINGNYMMTSTDNHRPEMVANGNALAQFYNNFNADYNHPTAERRHAGPRSRCRSTPTRSTIPRTMARGRNG